MNYSNFNQRGFHSKYCHKGVMALPKPVAQGGINCTYGYIIHIAGHRPEAGCSHPGCETPTFFPE